MVTGQGRKRVRKVILGWLRDDYSFVPAPCRAIACKKGFSFGHLRRAFTGALCGSTIAILRHRLIIQE